MYKLVTIDLDGTLLDSYGNVSEENKQAIKRVINQGCEVVLCSGRMPDSMENFAREIGADKYLISGNGSQIYDIQNKEILYSNYIEKQKILDIIQICEENSMYYCIYTESTIITKSLNYNVLYYSNENKTKNLEKKSNINLVENIYDYIKNMDKDIFLKMTVCDEDKVIFDNLIKVLRKIKGIDVLDVEHMSRKMITYGTEKFELAYYYTEITNANVNKWTAIENIIQKLDIKPEEVMAIGDNINDKEMIINAGIGIAVGNSAPYVKEMANDVVADNNSNGVAEALNKYIP